jgi:hypothetical protein
LKNKNERKKESRMRKGKSGLKTEQSGKSIRRITNSRRVSPKVELIIYSIYMKFLSHFYFLFGRKLCFNIMI